MYADAEDSGLGNSGSRTRTSSPIINNLRLSQNDEVIKTSKYEELENKLETAISSNKQKQIAFSK